MGKEKKLGRVIRLFVILFFLFSLFPVVFFSSNNFVSATNIIVDDGGSGDYTSIQDAINASSDGDTIYVWAGTYNENLTVNKSVSIIGNSSSNTLIISPHNSINENLINITSNWVNISNLHIDGNSSNTGVGIYSNNNHINISSCNFTEFFYEAILMEYDNNISVFNNLFYGNNEDAIYFESCDDSFIYNNYFLDYGNGFYFYLGGDSYIFNNTMVDCDTFIDIEEFNKISVYNNSLFDNVGGDSCQGLYLFMVENLTIYSNRIIGCEDYGIYLSGFLGSENKNVLIYDNYFDGNTQNIDDDGFNVNISWNITKILGTNIIGGPYLGGNYWPDYLGEDTDLDGLGDTLVPYNDSSAITVGGDYNPLVITDVFVDDDFTSSTIGWNFTCFDNIQDGIDAVSIGGNVHVWAGNYDEYNIIIDKSVNIIGNNSDVSIVDANSLGSCFVINSPAKNISFDKMVFSNTKLSEWLGALPNPKYAGVLINVDNSCLEITNCNFTGTGDNGVFLNMTNGVTSVRTIKSVDINNNSFYNLYQDIGDPHNQGYSIDLEGKYFVNNVSIKDNYFYESGGVYIEITSSINTDNNIVLENNLMVGVIDSGFQLLYLDNVSLINNDVSSFSVQSDSAYCYYFYDVDNLSFRNNYGKGDVDTSYNLFAEQVNNANISNNVFVDGEYGLFLDTCAINSVNNNNISSCVYEGIYLFASDNTQIYHNYVSGNGVAGIFLTNSCDNNLIYNNYFNNTNNSQSGTGTGNKWNISKTLGINIIGGPYLGGNYWSDYLGRDLDNDGLGDTLLPYNSSGGIVSGGDYHPLILPGYIIMNVYNESNCSECIPFDVLISNKNGSQTYEKNDNYCYVSIPITELPYGNDTIILVSSEKYNFRIFYVDLIPGVNLSMNVYLPPKFQIGSEMDIVIRSATDTNQVINDSYDVHINTTYPINQIISVQIYNISLYASYGGWIDVSSNFYNYTDYELVISKLVLDDNITMAKVNYYYEFNQTVMSSYLYQITVNDLYNMPISNAKIIVKRYINCTSVYENMSIVYTDGAGYADIYLIPNELYQFTTSKNGFTTDISYWVPTSVLFNHIIQLSRVIVENPNYDFFYKNVVFSAVMTGPGYMIPGNITVTYNDKNSSTINTDVYIFEYFNGSYTLKYFYHNVSNSFVVTNGSVNTTRSLMVKLFFNTTSNFVDVSCPVVLFVDAIYIYTNSSGFSKFSLDDRVTPLVGPFVINGVAVPWGSVIAFGLGMIILVLLGPFHVGVALIGCGLMNGFVSGLFSMYLTDDFPVGLVTLCPIFIVMGVLYIMSKGGRDYL